MVPGAGLERHQCLCTAGISYLFCHTLVLETHSEVNTAILKQADFSHLLLSVLQKCNEAYGLFNKAVSSDIIMCVSQFI
jgi:hypothetical protein